MDAWALVITYPVPGPVPSPVSAALPPLLDLPSKELNDSFEQLSVSPPPPPVAMKTAVFILGHYNTTLMDNYRRQYGPYHPTGIAAILVKDGADPARPVDRSGIWEMAESCPNQVFSDGQVLETLHQVFVCQTALAFPITLQAVDLADLQLENRGTYLNLLESILWRQQRRLR